MENNTRKSNDGIHPDTGKPKAVKVTKKTAPNSPDSGNYFYVIEVTYEGTVLPTDIDQVSLTPNSQDTIVLSYSSQSPGGSLSNPTTTAEYSTNNPGRSILDQLFNTITQISLLVQGVSYQNISIHFEPS